VIDFEQAQVSTRKLSGKKTKKSVDGVPWVSFFLLKITSPEYSVRRNAEIACLTWLRDNDRVESMFTEHGGSKRGS
jgi:hypothetical protein